MPRCWFACLACCALAACGRIGFDERTSGDDVAPSSIRITEVAPRWALPDGALLKIALEGNLDGITVTVDGMPCTDLAMHETNQVGCMAPAHAPGLVDVVATNALGDRARGDQPFTYVTRGMYQLGGPLDDRTSGVAVDAQGNVYVAGATTGDLDMPNAGDFDALLVKYDASGTFQWYRQLGTAAFDYARDVAVDPSGDVTIVGYTAGLLGTSTAGGEDVFVARFASNGDRRWLTQVGSPGNDQAWDLAVDPAGYTVVAAWTDGSWARANLGGLDYAILRFKPDGLLDWTTQDGSTVDDNGHSVAVAPEGTAFLVGYTLGSLEGTNAGGLDMFVARFETDGTRTWLRQRGSPAAEQAQDAFVDQAGEVFVAGMARGSLDGQPYGGAQDVFVMRFSPDGTWRWTRQHGGTGSENTFGVSVADGNVYVACNTSAAFAGQSYVGGGSDFCLVSLDRDGAHRWTRIAGSAGSDQASSCAFDAGLTGLVYVSLITDASLDGQPNRGSSDIAVAKFDPIGQLF